MLNKAPEIAATANSAADLDGVTFGLAPGLVTLGFTNSSEAESFRALRTNIMARHVEAGRRALAVCAATEGVGCTYVAANLAVALSQIGVKTLLVDANLRTPGVDKLFIPQTALAGVEQCLVNDETGFAEYIHADVLPNLSIMFSGGVPGNAQELLALDRFRGFMDFCMRDYEMTIVDTPHANSCSDAIRVHSVVGYGLVVLRRNQSLVSDVRTLIGQLENDHGQVIGTVLTET